jgi:hypothetical protein
MCRKSFEYTKIQHVPAIDREINSSFFICECCQVKFPLNKYNEHTLACNDSYTPKSLSSLSHQYQSLPVQRQNSNRSVNSTQSSASSNTATVSSANRNYINRFTFKCPYCTEKNFSASDLIDHCNLHHKDGEKHVVCPVCSVMPWGDPNQKSIDFITHLNWRHKFDYSYFVDFNKDDEEMFEMAINESMKSLRIKGY